MNETHNGFFRVIDKKTNKIIARYNYDKITAKERLSLRNQANKVALYCDCVPENSIEMKVTANLCIYPAHNNTGEKHDTACPKYKSADSKDWTYDPTLKAYSASSYIDAEQYIRRLNKLTYQDSEYYDKFDSLIGVRRAAGKILTKNRTRLNTLLNPKCFEKGKEYFIYMFLGKMTGIDGNYVKFLCSKEQNSDGITFYADSTQFNNLFRESQYYVIGEAVKKPLLIGGWVYLDDDNRLILTDFWLRAVNKDGRLFF